MKFSRKILSIFLVFILFFTNTLSTELFAALRLQRNVNLESTTEEINNLDTTSNNTSIPNLESTLTEVSSTNNIENDVSTSSIDETSDLPIVQTTEPTEILTEQVLTENNTQTITKTEQFTLSPEITETESTTSTSEDTQLVSPEVEITNEIDTTEVFWVVEKSVDMQSLELSDGIKELIEKDELTDDKDLYFDTIFTFRVSPMDLKNNQALKSLKITEDLDEFISIDENSIQSSYQVNSSLSNNNFIIDIQLDQPTTDSFEIKYSARVKIDPQEYLKNFRADFETEDIFRKPAILRALYFDGPTVYENITQKVSFSKIEWTSGGTSKIVKSTRTIEEISANIYYKAHILDRVTHFDPGTVKIEIPNFFEADVTIVPGSHFEFDSYKSVDGVSNAIIVLKNSRRISAGNGGKILVKFKIDNFLLNNYKKNYDDLLTSSILEIYDGKNSLMDTSDELKLHFFTLKDELTLSKSIEDLWVDENLNLTLDGQNYYYKTFAISPIIKKLGHSIEEDIFIMDSLYTVDYKGELLSAKIVGQNEEKVVYSKGLKEDTIINYFGVDMPLYDKDSKKLVAKLKENEKLVFTFTGPLDGRKNGFSITNYADAEFLYTNTTNPVNGYAASKRINVEITETEFVPTGRINLDKTLNFVTKNYTNELSENDGIIESKNTISFSNLETIIGPHKFKFVEEELKLNSKLQTIGTYVPNSYTTESVSFYDLENINLEIYVKVEGNSNYIFDGNFIYSENDSNTYSFTSAGNIISYQVFFDNNGTKNFYTIQSNFRLFANSAYDSFDKLQGVLSSSTSNTIDAILNVNGSKNAEAKVLAGGLAPVMTTINSMKTELTYNEDFGYYSYYDYNGLPALMYSTVYQDVSGLFPIGNFSYVYIFDKGIEGEYEKSSLYGYEIESIKKSITDDGRVKYEFELKINNDSSFDTSPMSRSAIFYFRTKLTIVNFTKYYKNFSSSEENKKIKNESYIILKDYSPHELDNKISFIEMNTFAKLFHLYEFFKPKLVEDNSTLINGIRPDEIYENFSEGYMFYNFSSGKIAEDDAVSTTSGINLGASTDYNDNYSTTVGTSPKGDINILFSYLDDSDPTNDLVLFGRLPYENPRNDLSGGYDSNWSTIFKSIEISMNKDNLGESEYNKIKIYYSENDSNDGSPLRFFESNGDIVSDWQPLTDSTPKSSVKNIAVFFDGIIIPSGKEVVAEMTLNFSGNDIESKINSYTYTAFYSSSLTSYDPTESSIISIKLLPPKLKLTGNIFLDVNKNGTMDKFTNPFTGLTEDESKLSGNVLGMYQTIFDSFKIFKKDSSGEQISDNFNEKGIMISSLVDELNAEYLFASNLSTLPFKKNTMIYNESKFNYYYSREDSSLPSSKETYYIFFKLKEENYDKFEIASMPLSVFDSSAGANYNYAISLNEEKTEGLVEINVDYAEYGFEEVSKYTNIGFTDSPQENANVAKTIRNQNYYEVGDRVTYEIENLKTGNYTSFFAQNIEDYTIIDYPNPSLEIERISLPKYRVLGYFDEDPNQVDLEPDEKYITEYNLSFDISYQTNQNDSWTIFENGSNVSSNLFSITSAPYKHLDEYGAWTYIKPKNLNANEYVTGIKIQATGIAFYDFKNPNENGSVGKVSKRFSENNITIVNVLSEQNDVEYYSYNPDTGEVEMEIGFGEKLLLEFKIVNDNFLKDTANPNIKNIQNFVTKSFKVNRAYADDLSFSSTNSININVKTPDEDIISKSPEVPKIKENEEVTFSIGGIKNNLSAEANVFTFTDNPYDGLEFLEMQIPSFNKGTFNNDIFYDVVAYKNSLDEGTKILTKLNSNTLQKVDLLNNTSIKNTDIDYIEIQFYHYNNDTRVDKVPAGFEINGTIKSKFKSSDGFYGNAINKASTYYLSNNLDDYGGSHISSVYVMDDKGISIKKELATGQNKVINPGDTVNYNITITNENEFDVTDLIIDDMISYSNYDDTNDKWILLEKEKIDVGNSQTFSISAKSSKTFSVSKTIPLTINSKTIEAGAKIENTATVRKISEVAGPSDTATVFTKGSGFRVEKGLVDKNNLETTQSDEIEYYVSITNIDTAKITINSIEDIITLKNFDNTTVEKQLHEESIAPLMLLINKSLNSGEILTTTFKYIVPSDILDNAEIFNTIYIESKEDLGTKKKAQSEKVTVKSKKVKIEKFLKNPTKTEYLLGDTIEYEIKVTNMGTKTLNKLTVSDSLDPTFSYLIPTLEIGKTITVPFFYTVTADSPITSLDDKNFILSNIATISGDNLNQTSNIVEVKIKIELPIIKKRIDINQKTKVGPDEEINYIIEVENKTSTVFKDLVVSDPMIIGFEEKISTLNPGDKLSFNATYKVPKNTEPGNIIINESLLSFIHKSKKYLFSAFSEPVEIIAVDDSVPPSTGGSGSVPPSTGGSGSVPPSTGGSGSIPPFVTTSKTTTTTLTADDKTSQPNRSEIIPSKGIVITPSKGVSSNTKPSGIDQGSEGIISFITNSSNLNFTTNNNEQTKTETVLSGTMNTINSNAIAIGDSNNNAQAKESTATNTINSNENAIAGSNDSEKGKENPKTGDFNPNMILKSFMLLLVGYFILLILKKDIFNNN